MAPRPRLNYNDLDEFTVTKTSKPLKCTNAYDVLAEDSESEAENPTFFVATEAPTVAPTPVHASPRVPDDDEDSFARASFSSEDEWSVVDTEDQSLSFRDAVKRGAAAPDASVKPASRAPAAAQSACTMRVETVALADAALDQAKEPGAAKRKNLRKKGGRKR